jgi:hypothetical protein
MDEEDEGITYWLDDQSRAEQIRSDQIISAQG